MQLEFSWENKELTTNDWKNITDKKLRIKMYNKAYQILNQEKIKLREKAYREANKDRIKKRDAAYHKANRDKRLKQSKAYREANRDKIKLREKVYREANRDKYNLWEKKYKQENIQFKLRKHLRSRLKSAIKHNFKAGSAIRDLGCTIFELKVYLESKFEIGMSWENYGFYGWHIDHIKPLSSFDLTDREQLLQAVHYTNLQPLWAKDNLSKGNKY